MWGYLQAAQTWLKNVRGFGCDVSDAIVTFNRQKRPNGTFISGSCTNPPSRFLANDSFDLVIAGFCLNNIVDSTMQLMSNSDEQTERMCDSVRELYRITKPGGGMYFPQTYESDAVGHGANQKWSDVPLHFVATCLPQLPFVSLDSGYFSTAVHWYSSIRV